MRYIREVIILFLLFEAVLSADASGVKVNPSKLEIAVKANESISEEIIVTNPTSDVQIFKAYPDDFPDIIKVNPASFTLEAGTDKKVNIAISAIGDQKPLGVFKTNISVVAKPLAETQFEANAGVKIPISITIAESGSPRPISKWEYYAYVFAASIGAGGITHFLRRKRMASG